MRDGDSRAEARDRTCARSVRSARGNPRMRAQTGRARDRSGRRDPGAWPEVSCRTGRSRYAACAMRASKRQVRGMIVTALRVAARWALDFALPARCAGCGTIVGEVHGFCPDCWRQIEFLGDSGCATCGLPLQATEMTTCAICLARPQRIARTRAAVAYDELSRGLAIRLKYERKVAIARTMARYMAPLVGGSSNPVLVAVPLHRTRLWRRGFNQSALV